MERTQTRTEHIAWWPRRPGCQANCGRVLQSEVSERPSEPPTSLKNPRRIRRKLAALVRKTFCMGCATLSDTVSRSNPLHSTSSCFNIIMKGVLRCDFCANVTMQRELPVLITTKTHRQSSFHCLPIASFSETAKPAQAQGHWMVGYIWGAGCPYSATSLTDCGSQRLSKSSTWYLTV